MQAMYLFQDSLSNCSFDTMSDQCYLRIHTVLKKHSTNVQSSSQVTEFVCTTCTRCMFFCALPEGRGSATRIIWRFEDMEDVAADHNTWWQLCLDGTPILEEERTIRRQQERFRRHTAIAASTTIITYTCPTCIRTCEAKTGLFSHQRSHR